MNAGTRFVALFAALAITAGCAGASASDESTRLVSIGAGLSGAQGSRASVYAEGLTHASAFAFDASNRLWIATAAYSDEGKDGVYLVTKSGAAPVRVIASLHTPLGLLWYQGSLYVASKERVDVYSGLVGTRFASHRRILKLPSEVGEVNNIVLAPDGRLLLGISAPCDHCTPTSKYSGAIVSFRTDGSDVRVYASDIRAAVGLAYKPGTSDLYVTMNQRDDLGDATPGDWLALVTEGSSWGFPDGTAPQPTAVLDKHAAASGIAISSDTVIVAEWATGKVLSVALAEENTSTYLTGLKNPVPVAYAPDGALFVGDWTTGTIYRITSGA